MHAVVDRWLHSYHPEDVINALLPQLTEERRARIEAVLAARLSRLTVVIENLHDPHNGAAAIRSVEAFGLTQLHVVEQAEPFRFSPRVTQGCEKWIELRRHQAFAACADELHGRGFALLAAVPNCDQRVDELDPLRPTALVFGNEHTGLSGEALARCDARFTIPMHGFTQSFNLSVSVALSVYEWAKRRRANQPGDLQPDELSRLKARYYALSMDERAAEGLVARHAAR